MKTNNPGKLYPPRHVGSRLAALLATLLLLLAPASVLADKGYIVKLSDDGKTLIYTAGDESEANNETSWTLSNWIQEEPGGTVGAAQPKIGANKLGDAAAAVTTVRFEESFESAEPNSTAWWFANLTNLKTIEGLNKLNTSKVTNMAHMFRCCSNLESLDLSNFNTVNVEDMQFLFQGCYSLTSLDLSTFNTANVKNMSSMFSQCNSLLSLTFGNDFSTANVTDMSSMFILCYKLSNLDLSRFNTNQVTSMSWMFCSCSNFKSLDISSFNTTSVTSMDGMFSNCTALVCLNIGNGDFLKSSSATTALQSVNSNCKLMVSADFDVSALGKPDESGQYAFNGKKIPLQLTLDETKENSFAASEEGIVYSTVVLKRSFNSGVWNTLVVPFGITAEEAKAQFGDDVKIAKYINVENTDGKYTLHFTTITAIEAHQPVFIYGVTKDGPYTFTSKTVKTGTPEAGDDKLKFVGTYVAGNVTQGDYFIDTNNTLWLATGNTNTIKATRATFRPANTSGAKTATFVIDGETTAINLPAMIGTANGAAYNLQGQRVGNDYKGVVIRNGRKYVRK